MRIGIVPSLTPSSGGIYQYGLSMLQALMGWSKDGGEDEFVVFSEDVRDPSLARLDLPSAWTVESLMSRSFRQRGLGVVRQIVGEGPHRDAWRWLRRRFAPARRKDLDAVEFRTDINDVFRRSGVELMLYPAPYPPAFEAGIPYVMAIHDLQHRLNPEFPEFSTDGEWESREYYYRNGSRYATLLLADSEVGKEDILTFYGPYGVTADRIKVLPFLPASYLATDVPDGERRRVRATYSLPDRYLFYPAQFWPHKNHAVLIRALGLLRQERFQQIPVVFCGSYSGEIRESVFSEVLALARQAGLEPDVHYLGFVPDKDMAGLYAGATALVMPTLFGPTNIPVVEAWALRCPVLTSDIRGIREHVQDAAIRVDPRSVEAIADGIYRVWTDEPLRLFLAERGRRRLSEYTPTDYRRLLVEILREAKMRVRCETPRIAIR